MITRLWLYSQQSLFHCIANLSRMAIGPPVEHFWIQLCRSAKAEVLGHVLQIKRIKVREVGWNQKRAIIIFVQDRDYLSSNHDENVRKPVKPNPE